MADKYEGAKCFILSEDGYDEITYSELCRRRDTDESYKGRKYIPLQGMLMEVTTEEYDDFYKKKNRQLYLKKQSASVGDISYDMLTTDEFSGEDILIDESQDVASQVEVHIMTDKLRSCIAVLTEDEQALIRALFYEGKTERKYAEECGVYRNAIHYKKCRILAKLKKLLVN